MAGPKSSLRNLWEGQENLLMSRTAHHGKVSSKSFPELDLSLLPRASYYIINRLQALFSHVGKILKVHLFFLASFEDKLS